MRQSRPTPNIILGRSGSFLQFYKNGLAYKAKAPVDFCPQCNTTLAREQVWGEDRHCERCGTPVVKKDLEQWFFRITNYAEELLDHSKMDWPERVVTMQRNWIGRSEGADVVFQVGGRGRYRRLYHAARHPVGGHLYGVGARAPPGGQVDDAGASG